ncbi:tripartite tricarboxylate transporter TctB family protein [Cytobacillus oceanisediminis]|uniref:tripartite tricarboxylate transporter TctB family protein n=1 Tax=Cytobacillus TaxID=2675230 RepID=UPI00203D644C|nr:tripartite tricarboxylate transporter TctB family protein [Cytobacillus oceanisediminis]MCM3244193.1 tripartite tricarboxylate transporter TctB family protein [Cytobacillus oceanisediminis]
MQLERNLSIIMIVFSSFFLVMSLQVENRTGNIISAGTWPAALMILMLILSVILLMRALKVKNVENIKGDDIDSADADNEEQLVHPRKFFLLFAVLATYIFILGYVGFIAATILGIFVMALLFGMKSYIRALLTGILATAGSIVLFPILLNLPFPRGTGIFYSLSLLFY